MAAKQHLVILFTLIESHYVDLHPFGFTHTKNIWYSVSLVPPSTPLKSYFLWEVVDFIFTWSMVKFYICSGFSVTVSLEDEDQHGGARSS